MNWLRNTNYRDLFDGMFFIGFILAFASGGLLAIIVFPIGLLLITLKVGTDIYDWADEK